MFTHVVLFWLKDDADDDAGERLLADCRGMLAKIPTVRLLDAGVPAMVRRDVVDNSYAVGLMVRFDDRAGYDVYADHPIHQEFIQLHRAAWKKVLVYDFA